MLMKVAEGRHSPLLNLRVLCVPHEDTPDLLLCPIALEKISINKALSERERLTRPIRFAPGFLPR